MSDDQSPSQPDDQIPASLPPPLSPSPLGLRRRNILGERKRARECLTDQAERMAKRSRIEQTGNKGSASSYGGQGQRGDSRNILGVIMDKNDKKAELSQR